MTKPYKKRPLRFAALQLISTAWDLPSNYLPVSLKPCSTLNLVFPLMDGKQTLPYMDTDG